MVAGAKPGRFLDLHGLVLACFGRPSPPDTRPPPSMAMPGFTPVEWKCCQDPASRGQCASSRRE